MKDIKERNRFMDLRAQVKSFDFISKEINVSKPTLIKWSKEYQIEISNLLALHSDELREKYLISKEQRLKVFHSLVLKIESEIETRNFTDMPTEKLIEYYDKIRSQVVNELKVEFREEVEYKLEVFPATIEKWSI